MLIFTLSSDTRWVAADSTGPPLIPISWYICPCVINPPLNVGRTYLFLLANSDRVSLAWLCCMWCWSLPCRKILSLAGSQETKWPCWEDPVAKNGGQLPGTEGGHQTAASKKRALHPTTPRSWILPRMMWAWKQVSRRELRTARHLYHPC